MADVPVTPYASQTERDLAELEAKRTALLAKKAEIDAQKAAATYRQREAAIALHQELCTDVHPGGRCTWFSDNYADDPNAADWAEEQHRRWLTLAILGVAVLVGKGWAVTAPPEP